MNRRRHSHLFALVLALALPFLLVACGNKGPLVLPDKQTTEAPVADEATEQATDPAPAADPPAASEPPPQRER